MRVMCVMCVMCVGLCVGVGSVLTTVAIVSASGYACLVYTLARLFNVEGTDELFCFGRHPLTSRDQQAMCPTWPVWGPALPAAPCKQRSLDCVMCGCCCAALTALRDVWLLLLCTV